MKRICVFAGSNSGLQAEYLAAARELGHALARHEVGLVYGGARVGLMGALADAVLAERGHVTGVIPKALGEGGRPRRPFRPSSRRVDACAEGRDGGSCGWFHRLAGWVGHVGRVL